MNAPIEPSPMRATFDAIGIEAPAVHRCAGDCGSVVPERNSTCLPCSTRIAAELRGGMLTRAYASLPAWPWARFGPELTALVKSRELLGAAHAWRRDRRNIVLLGESGDGKTACAVAIAHRILDYARDRVIPADALGFAAGVRFVSAKDLAIARRSCKLGVEAPLDRAATRATLLVLDELGYEPQTETTIADVVDRRYRSTMPTIVTSALTEEGIAARYGEAMKRRLCELGQVVDARPARERVSA